MRALGLLLAVGATTPLAACDGNVGDEATQYGGDPAEYGLQFGIYLNEDPGVGAFESLELRDWSDSEEKRPEYDGHFTVIERLEANINSSYGLFNIADDSGKVWMKFFDEQNGIETQLTKYFVDVRGDELVFEGSGNQPGFVLVWQDPGRRASCSMRRLGGDEETAPVAIDPEARPDDPEGNARSTELSAYERSFFFTIAAQAGDVEARFFETTTPQQAFDRTTCEFVGERLGSVCRYRVAVEAADPAEPPREAFEFTCELVDPLESD